MKQNKQKTPYRIVLADDHLMFRKGIKSIIKESNDLLVVGEAGDGLELLKLLKKIVPDMVIMDISMPHLRGIEATHEIKMICPEIKVLILSMHKNQEYLLQALSARADGYLLKEDTDDEIFNAIDIIQQGEIYLSPLLSKAFNKNLKNFVLSHGKPDQNLLSIREKEVLTLIAEGKANKEIAGLLCISPRTVEHHRASIYNKLDIDNIAGLIKYAIRKGYTTQEP